MSETLCADCFDRYAVGNVAHTDTLTVPTVCARCGAHEAYAVCLTEYLRPARVRHFLSCDDSGACTCATSEDTVFLCDLCEGEATDYQSISTSDDFGTCDRCNSCEEYLTEYLTRTLIPEED